MNDDGSNEGVDVGDDAGYYAKIQGSQTDRQPAVYKLYRILLSPCLSQATGWLLGYFQAVCFFLAAWLLPFRFPASLARRSLLALADD